MGCFLSELNDTDETEMQRTLEKFYITQPLRE
jgi:hypothetical protein